MMSANGKEVVRDDGVEWTSTQAKGFILGVIAGVGSIILENRELISPENITRRRLRDEQFPFVKKTTVTGAAFWKMIGGISDALSRQHLKEILIITAAGDREGDEVYEVYTVTISYSGDCERISMIGSDGREVGVVAYSGRHAMFAAASRMLRKLDTITAMLPHLPEGSIGRVRLNYYPGKPLQYHPPAFMRMNGQLDLGSHGIDMGIVNARHFGCNVRVGLSEAAFNAVISNNRLNRSSHSSSADTAPTHNSQPIIAVDADNDHDEATDNGTANAPSKATRTTTSGIGTMTTAPGAKRRINSPRALEMVKTSRIEQSRAEDSGNDSISTEGNADVLVYEGFVGREKIRRYEARKKQAEARMRQVPEREVAYLSQAIAPTVQSSSGSNETNATKGSSTTRLSASSPSDDNNAARAASQSQVVHPSVHDASLPSKISRSFAGLY